MYSVIAGPLSNLLQKDQPYVFNTTAKDTFKQLKTLLVQNPVLKIYHPQRETELHTDASIEGYGAVLMQRSLEDNLMHPIYYISKKLNEKKEIIVVTS